MDFRCCSLKMKSFPRDRESEFNMTQHSPNSIAVLVKLSKKVGPKSKFDYANRNRQAVTVCILYSRICITR